MYDESRTQLAQRMYDESRTELIQRRNLKGMDRCGDGIARFYAKDDQSIYFGTFTLAPMAVGGIDAGHPRGEYFYCHEGRFVLILHRGEKKEYFEVEAGDAVFVPKNVDHQLINDTNVRMVSTFVILF